MRRLTALGVLLAASLAWLMLWGSPVVGQPPSGALQPFGAVRIVGRHNQVANVNHTGQLAVEATVNATVTTDNVNVFHQSTIRHISSATHVVGAVSLVSQLGAYVTLTGTALDVNCTGCAAASVVNVGHVSAVTHVALVGWPQWFHVTNLGHITGAIHLAGNVTDQNYKALRVIGADAFSVAHVSSVTHVRGLISIRDDNCATCRMRIDHYNMLVVQPHISGALRTWQVTQCGSTASLAINTNANRRDLWVMNRGNGNIYIGYGATGHVALTADNGWPLHATASAITTTARHSTALSTLYLQNYQGPLACITDTANTGQRLQVMEILR